MITVKHWKKDTVESNKEGVGQAEEIEWLEKKQDWAKLKSVMMVEAIREVIGGAKTVEKRYFISSLEANAEEALRAVRGHWAIENELHWWLDIGCARRCESNQRSQCGRECAQLSAISD